MTASRGLRSRRTKHPREALKQNTVERDGCLVWIAATNDAGYGVSWDGSKTKLAHRLAWELEHGPLGLRVLRHTCDNPPCVRLEHLRPGTHADNVADKVARGRSGRKLSDDAIADIKANYIKGNGSSRLLAEKYDTTARYIWRVATKGSV